MYIITQVEFLTPDNFRFILRPTIDELSLSHQGSNPIIELTSYSNLMTDDEIRTQAIEFAKQNKKRIARELTDITKYKPDATPISVFMAGSPGAGKTEFSKNLILLLEEDQDRRVIRIDGDEIRSLLPGYTGKNSHLFQGAISLVVEKMYDLILRNKQTFIMDGTFSRYEKAVDNVARSLQEGRHVFIFYLYQRPETAWNFTKAREKAEGRNIPQSAFIEQFLGAQEAVTRIRNEFGPEVAIFLVKKDFERNIVEEVVKIEPQGKPIDEYLNETYSKEKLETFL